MILPCMDWEDRLCSYHIHIILLYFLDALPLFFCFYAFILETCFDFDVQFTNWSTENLRHSLRILVLFS